MSYFFPSHFLRPFESNYVLTLWWDQLQFSNAEILRKEHAKYKLIFALLDPFQKIVVALLY